MDTRQMEIYNLDCRLISYDANGNEKATINICIKNSQALNLIDFACKNEMTLEINGCNTEMLGVPVQR